MDTFPIDKAKALCTLYPEDFFTALVNDRLVTFKGSVMKGFLLDSDTVYDFKRFA